MTVRNQKLVSTEGFSKSHQNVLYVSVSGERDFNSKFSISDTHFSLWNFFEGFSKVVSGSLLLVNIDFNSLFYFQYNLEKRCDIWLIIYL